MENYSSYSDDQLLALLSNEDQQAFEILYDRYWEDLYLLAYLMLRNKEASKDIVQEVFIWLWEHRLSLQIKSLRAYLKTAVKYKVANHIRSGNIRESVFQKLSAVSTSLDNASALEMVEVKEMQHHIKQEIAQLPDKCRQVFRLRREARLSTKEIAQRLQISVKTVENQMTIALRRLQYKKALMD